MTLYIKEVLGIRLLNYLLFAVLAFAVHVLVNNKYLGHFVMVVYYIVADFLPAVGIEHKLWRFPETARYIYSDMNGYGHFLGPHFLFKFYWAAFALLLALLGHLFWVRGTDTSVKVRAKIAWKRFNLKTQAFGLAALALMITLGSIIYYNTTVLNEFKTQFEEQAFIASYEKKYKQYEQLPQPRITDVKVNADIFPYERKVRLEGSYIIKNKTAVPIPAVHVGIDPEVKISKMTFDKILAKNQEDTEYGYFIYTFRQPLAPGETTTLQFEVLYQPKGFKNNGLDTKIVYNGTFFNSRDYMPHIGYRPDIELTDDDIRKKHDLKPKARMAAVDDMAARKNNYLSYDSDWVTFDATVSTARDQVAICPGYLQKEWMDGDRRYYHYKLDKKTLNFFSFVSARYEVKRSTWKNVDIEVFYHKGHDYNVDRMIKAVKESLAYFTANFGPYQHSLVRILEFPRYARFAQSFPTTIPFSEGIGFIARVEEGDVDYPFEVTAHEVAHQWWAHQVIGANVQGATLLSEVLAQYSALMVSRENFDREVVRKGLKYDMDRYFRGRSRERKKRSP